MEGFSFSIYFSIYSWPSRVANRDQNNCFATMTATPPTGSTLPNLGSSSGWALDVIVVAPSPKSTDKGVAASSDFYASFPSSLDPKKNSFKRLASFGSKNASPNVSESGDDDLLLETKTSSLASSPPIPKGNVQVRINGRYIPKLDMIMFSKKTSSCRFVHGNGLRPPVGTLQMIIDGTDDNDESEVTTTCTCSEAVKNSEHHLCVKNNQSSGERQSAGPILSYGRNLIKYTLISEKGVAIASTEAHLYLWSALDSVIVSDIDGTVTKDNVGGVMDTVVQEKFAHIHNGICKFYQDLAKISPVEDMDALNISGDEEGQIRFMYLSSRPISLANSTRKLLRSVSQMCEAKEWHNLPAGPMMCNVVPLTSVLFSELVSKNVHEFKSDVLQRQVVVPFVAARGEELRNTKTAKSARALRTTELEDIDENNNPRSFSDNYYQSPMDDRLFLAGFGNTLRDAMAYEMAGMDRDDIYIIDTKSRIMQMGERSQSQLSEDSNNSDCIPSISDFIVDGVCCLGSGESQAGPGNEPNMRKSQDSPNKSNFVSTRDVFDEKLEDCSSEYQTRSNKKTTIRAFSTKKSLAKFPSFASSASSKSSKSKKLIYQGYDDPRLLEAVRKRIQGD